MSQVLSFPNILLAGVVLCGLIGCGNSTSLSPLQTNPSAQTLATSRSAELHAQPHLLYLSDDDDVIVYPANQNNPPPIRTITDGINQPQGLAVDRNGILYVANSAGNNVTEYRAGESVPFRTVSKGIHDPEGIAVDSNGTLYVGNRELAQQEVYVTEYARGTRAPSLTITFPKHNLPQIGGLAIDSAFNLYVMTVLDTASVTKFPQGSTQGTNLGLQGIGASGDGLAIDAADNLYVGTSTGAINMYPPGATQPVRKIRNGLVSPAFFVATASGALYVPNQANGNGGTVMEFMPNRNKAKFTIGSFLYPRGTAVF
jgi:sugar lactone lactonase YvrE